MATRRNRHIHGPDGEMSRRVVFLTVGTCMAVTVGVTSLGGTAGAARTARLGASAVGGLVAAARVVPNVKIATPGPAYTPASVTGKVVGTKACGRGGGEFSFCRQHHERVPARWSSHPPMAGGTFGPPIPPGQALGVCVKRKGSTDPRSRWPATPTPRSASRSGRSGPVPENPGAPSRPRGCVVSVDRLSPLDASFLHVEDSVSHMHIGSVAVLEGPSIPPSRTVVDRIESKLPLVPWYRQVGAVRPLRKPGPAGVGGRDPHFNIDYHLPPHRSLRPPRGARTNCGSWSAGSCPSPSTGPGRCGRYGWSRASTAASGPCCPRRTTPWWTASPAPT